MSALHVSFNLVGYHLLTPNEPGGYPAPGILSQHASIHFLSHGEIPRVQSSV